MKKILIILSMALLASTQVGAVGAGVPGRTFWFSYEEFWGFKDSTGKYLDDYIKVGMLAGDVSVDKTLLKEIPELWEVMNTKGYNSDYYKVDGIYDRVGDRSKRKWSNEWVWGFGVTKIRTGPRSEYE